MQCKSCGADLPDDARFCIECGAEMTGPAQTGATVQLPRPAGATKNCPTCGAANPDFAAFCVRCGQPMAEATPVTAGGPRTPQSLPRSATRPQPAYRRFDTGSVAGVLFVLGLAALFLLKLPFWPGILIVIGLTAFTSEALSGRYFNGLSSAIWLFGLAFLFMVPRLWWPGILVLIAASMLLEMARRALRAP